MDIFDVAEAIKDHFSKLLGDTAWFHDYLHGKVKAGFEENRTVFMRDDFFSRINDVGLARVLAKCVVGLYNDKVERMLGAERVSVVRTSEECKPGVPDLPVDEGLVEASFTVEAISEEDCPCPAPECPAQDYLADDCPFEDSPMKEASVQVASTDEPLIAEEMEPVLERAPEPKPAAEEDDWGSFVNSKKKKEKKKAKKGAIEVVEEVLKVKEEPTVTAAPADGEVVNSELGTCSVDSTGEPVAQAEENVTLWPLNPTKEVDELVSNDHSALKADSEQPTEAEGEICPLRVKHLLDGDKWKHCRQCRAIVRQVAIQLARAAYTDEDGYEIVDQVLIK